MANLFADENFPLPVVEYSRGFGHNVLTVQDTGQSGKALSDIEVLASARELGRALLTLNRRHFLRLHADRVAHEGIIACTFDENFDHQAARIHSAIESEGELTGKFVRVNRPARKN